MKIDVLPKIQRDLWKALAEIPEVRRFYLAGGTAVALHLEHRESIDFDFFQFEPFGSPRVIQALEKIGTVRIENQSEDTLVGFLSGVKLSFFRYPYALIEPLLSCEGISIADLRDLAAMKIIAISQRGVKKDFLDLHALIKAGWNLEAIFQCVDLKYPNQKQNRLHLLKSLTYFKDAEGDPMPKMIRPVSWKTVKQDLDSAVSELLR